MISVLKQRPSIVMGYALKYHRRYRSCLSDLQELYLWSLNESLVSGLPTFVFKRSTVEYDSSGTSTAINTPVYEEVS